MSKTNVGHGKKRYIVRIYGIVQGVGFRPFIYNEARKFNICGWVKNCDSMVMVDIEGTKSEIKGFLLSVIKNPPSLAKLEKINITSHPYYGYGNFMIKRSSKTEEKLNFISPDMASCSKCIEETLDPKSRRYRFPFTNCTECGPRYSIIKDLPYDRQNTTMDSFKMCKFCENEYNDPISRRFHTQPNCCNSCGPKLTLKDRLGKEVICSDPIKETARLLKLGKIISIKGIGGFHLACDAFNEKAIDALRLKKRRPHKPLAIMVKDIDFAHRICEIGEKERAVLLGPERPIVLLRKKKGFLLPRNIAPLNKRIGVMLPYTPLHYLLFQENVDALVMTSGNISGFPIQFKNDEAFKNLNTVADYFLFYNRDINVPIDDSVVKVVNNERMVIRNGRGYAPLSINTGINREILALGAEEKSTFSFSQKGYSYISQYIGDLKDLRSFEIYKYSIENLLNMFKVRPEIFAHDLNRNYLSSFYAEVHSKNKISVQHHHAHMVSCMAENHLNERVIGVIYDGTGLGTDGNIWGGEFLVGNRREFMRVAHFRYVKIQGGDKSVEEPWRTALSYLYSMDIKYENFLNSIEDEKVSNILMALNTDLNCYKSSSVGRFFDCVAAIIGLRKEITYEGQAAIELENIADESVKESYEYTIRRVRGVFEIGYEKVILGILTDLKKNVSLSVISSKFHNTVCNITFEVVCRIRDLFKLKDVVLSGGVFQNDYILKTVYKKLTNQGFNVYYNKKIPINDSGISFGQLSVAYSLIGE